ncbi:uncharacterized protein M6B38_151180 [Iris pallida]|uniref:Uncharacterized protein n=1 Tax=Iris pallida TaxID=29817 RepID=A0AAX6F611_IRIPA|nr:uncharacterized protein M6B38_151180 [Iris pallida]
MLIHNKLRCLLSSFTKVHGKAIHNHDGNCHHLLLSTLLGRFSTFEIQNPSPKPSTLEIQNPSPKPHFMVVEYLINSCGFSLDRAKRASKHLTGIKSTLKPDSVLRFLRQCGFGDADITKLLSKDPGVLCSDVDRTLKPKFTALQGMGFSECELIQLASATCALRHRDLQPKIEYLRSLLGTNDRLIKSCRRDNNLLSANLNKRIIPNVSFLKELGIPDCQIATMIVSIPRLIGGHNPDYFKALVKWAEELGFSIHSGMFPHVLHFVTSNKKGTFDAKYKLLKSLGWSEMDIMSAFRKQPRLFNLSDQNLCRKMDFFVKEVGFEISTLACYPVLLSLSLEKRLKPRHSVLRLLKRDELPAAKANDFIMSKGSFMERYLVPQKDKVPGLHKAYVAACAGKDPQFPSMHTIKERRNI